ncbi:MAG: hypothetical protein ACLFQ5_01515 [Oceanicaulis sp.]
MQQDRRARAFGAKLDDSVAGPADELEAEMPSVKRGELVNALGVENNPAKRYGHQAGSS